MGFVLGTALVLSTQPGEPAGVAVGSRSDVRVLLTTPYLTRQIRDRAGGVGIRHLQLRTVPPSILRAGMDVSAAWFSVPVALRLQPTAHAGTLHLRVLSAKVVGVPVPLALAQFLVDVLNSSTQHILGPRARVVDVKVVRQGVEVGANYGR